MARSILLGFLTTAIISITLTEAIAIDDTEVVEGKEKINLDSVCTSSKVLDHCLFSSTSNIHNVEFSSKLPLQNVAKVFLSGSMFQGCNSKPKQQNYLAQNISHKYAQNSTDNWGCIFSWQDSSNYETNSQDKSQTFLSTDITNDLDIPNNLPQSISLEKTYPKFPKLSRSSLIVSFPTADSTFKPKNSKLANPAPKTKRIASPFGWRKRPYSYRLQFHQGMDYGAPLGSPVVAVGDGIVTKIVSGCYDFGNLYCGGQLGNWIEIDHGNGAIGTYGHLKNSSITIKEGMKVWKNQEIAQVGSSGWSTGAHLDFRLKINGEYEDPAKHLTPPTFSDL